MTRLLRSIASQLFLLLLIFTLTFFMIRSFPGDPARMIAGQQASPETVAEIRHRLGLDLSLPHQYAREFKNIFIDFDLGYSYAHNRPVKDEMLERIPATIELSSVAMLLAILFGIPLGMLAARHRGSWFDVLITQFSLLGVSIPVFLLGYLLIMFFEGSTTFDIANRLDFGTDAEGGYYLWGSLITGDWATMQEAWRHIFIPALALATIPLSMIMRLTRSAVLEVLNEDFLRTAKAKGLSDFQIYFKHILKVIATTLVTMVGLQVAALMSGAVLTESVFSWNGMGSYMIDAIESSSYPVIQACILFFACVFIVMHFCVDLLYVLIDPRLRQGE